MKQMVLDFASVLVALVVLIAMLLLGCDENDPMFPGVEVQVSATPGGEVHGTISVSPSPLPPFEVRFRETPSPTPVKF